MAPTSYLSQTHLNRPDGTQLVLYHHEPRHTADLTLVLVHGWSASARVWDSMLDDLAADARLRIITYDQRGHGASTAGHNAPSINVLADDLDAVLTATNPDAPAVLVGHSMGSMTLLAYAASKPHRLSHDIAGILLVSASGGRMDPRQPGHPPLTRAIGTARNALAEVCVRAPRPTGHLRHLVQPSTDPRPPTDIAAEWYRAILRFDVTGQLAALQRIPVHLVTGALDRVIPPIHTCRLAAQLPHARLHVAEGVGHCLPTERPLLLLSLLAELLAQIRHERAGGMASRLPTDSGRSPVLRVFLRTRSRAMNHALASKIGRNTVTVRSIF